MPRNAKVSVVIQQPTSYYVVSLPFFLQSLVKANQEEYEVLLI